MRSKSLNDAGAQYCSGGVTVPVHRASVEFAAACLFVAPIFYLYRVPAVGVEPIRVVELGVAGLLIASFILGRLQITYQQMKFFGFLFLVGLVPSLDLLRIHDPSRFGANVANHLASLLLVPIVVLICSDSRALWKMARVCALGSIGALAIGIYRYAFGSLPLSQFVETRVGSTTSLADIAVTYLGDLRLSAAFYDPNFYGMYLVIVLGIIVNRAMYGSRRLLWLMLLVVNVFAVVFTMSRTSMIGLLVVGVVTAAIERRFWRPFAVALTAIVVVVAVLGVSGAVPAFYTLFDRFGDVQNSAGRLPYHLAGRDAFFDSPFVGVGSEGLLGYVQVYRVTDNASTHMVYLSWLAKYGLVGAAVYFAFILYPVIRIVFSGAFRVEYRQLVAAVYFPLFVMYTAYDYFGNLAIQYLAFGFAWAILVNRIGCESSAPYAERG